MGARFGLGRFGAIALAAVAIVAAVLFESPAASGRSSSGELQPQGGSSSSIVGECPFDATIITGRRNSALTLGDAVWCVVDADIRGGLKITRDADVTVLNSTIGGPITSTAAFRVMVCDSRVGGAITVKKTTDAVTIGDPDNGCPGNVIGGGITAKANTGGVTIKDNDVSGPIQTGGNTPAADVSGNF